MSSMKLAIPLHSVAGAEDTRQPKLPESLLRMRAGHVRLARSYKNLRMLDARV